jgi:hypothetical protein
MSKKLPCEHNFDGWREFPDGNGGERFCQKCGLGAMAYTLSLDWADDWRDVKTARTKGAAQS